MMRYPPMTPGLAFLLMKKQTPPTGGAPPVPASALLGVDDEPEYPRVVPPAPSSVSMAPYSRDPMTPAAVPLGGAPMPPPPSSVRPLALRSNTYQYAPMPTAPTLEEAPTLDPRAVSRMGGGSLIAGLLAGALTGDAGAATAAIRGYGSGAQTAQADADQRNVTNWQNRTAATNARYAQDRAAVQDANAITARQQQGDAQYNTAEVNRFRTETKAEQDARNAAAREAHTKATESLATEQAHTRYRNDLTDLLLTLPPSGQQEELARRERTGELERNGVNFEKTEDGRFITNLTSVQQVNREQDRNDKKTAQAAATATAADDKKRKGWESALGQAYKDFADPRTTKEGRERAAFRINTLEGEKFLNIAAGNPLTASMIASMTPQQRESLELQRKSLKQRQQSEANAQKYRALSRADRLAQNKARTDADVLKNSNDARKVFNANATRLNTVVKELGSTPTPARRAMLEVEREQLLDSQAYLVDRVPGMSDAVKRAYKVGTAPAPVPASRSTAPRRVPAPTTTAPRATSPAKPKTSRFTRLPDE